MFCLPRTRTIRNLLFIKDHQELEQLVAATTTITPTATPPPHPPGPTGRQPKTCSASPALLLLKSADDK